MDRSFRDPNRNDARVSRSRVAAWLTRVGVRLLAVWGTGLIVAWGVVRPLLDSRVELHQATAPPAWYEAALSVVHACGAAGLALLVAGLLGAVRRRPALSVPRLAGSRVGRAGHHVADDELPLADEMEDHSAAGRTGSKQTGRWERAAATYVPVSYPVALGVASFVWAVAGWLAAAFAPRLAFVPAAGVLHFALPTVTVGLLAANLYFAVRSLLRGAHALRLLVVTGVEVALFTTLFFQLYAHVGAELYDAPGPTRPWQWLAFSAAHALRAGDVLDAVEAYGLSVQPVRHVSPLVAVFVVAYHVVVDVFFLGLVWAAVGRYRERALADEKFRGLTTGVGLAAFAVWFVVWVAVAFFVRPWRAADVPLWFAENALRVVDFADVMESFDVRLHTLPREGVVGTLTLLCRLWFALGLMVLVTRKRAPAARRVLTPPGAAAGRFWGGRVGMLAGMAALFVATGLGGLLLAGRPEESLVAAVRAGPDDRAADALRALRRMGPAARDAVPPLVAMRADAPPAVRDGITRTLGYLGPAAATALRDIALGGDAPSAGVAVDALAAGGGRNAPDVVAVWARHPSEAVRGRAEAALLRLGPAATGPLTDGMTAANSHDHYVWLENLDPNWRLRDTANPIARSCQNLPELLRRARGGVTPDEAVAVMREIEACGSAAAEAVDPAFDLLDTRDHKIIASAVGVLRAAGPYATPRILTRAVTARPAVRVSAFVALDHPDMWSAAALADPRTLPALLDLVRYSEVFPRVVEPLGRCGPAAAPALPTLLPAAADDRPEIRAKVRAALDRIRPGWMTEPALTEHVAGLLYPVSKLPPAEAAEFYAAFGDVPPARAEAVVAEARRQLDRVNQSFPPTANWTREYPGLYARGLDPVFAPVERLRAKGKALVPLLRVWVRDNEVARQDPRAAIVNDRLRQTITAVGGTP